tara:strand:+ start:528 stop:1619 length:1092 start_codon:yes stop_codon:yes gene_type:complete
MSEQNESLPNTDDVPSSAGPNEQELLDAVLSNTEFLRDDDVPLPEEEVEYEDPEATAEEDPDVADAAVSDEESEEDTEEAEDEDGAEAPTQEAAVFTVDDLDLDARVSVKIDGEEMEVSFADLLKGYQTDASLSKKGRELGEARKAIDEERVAKLSEITKMSDATNAMLTMDEQKLAKQYHDIEAKIKEARDSGDTYELSDLKDQREQSQQKYWTARNTRENLLKTVEEQKTKLQEEQFASQMQHFQEVIPQIIPDFNDKVAVEIREFALENGIADELLNSVIDPNVVKFIDDYRRLKNGITKGAAKRKDIPTKKVPTKKPAASNKKAADKEKMVKARAFKEGSSKDDQMDFLRQYASNSLTK